MKIIIVGAGKVGYTLAQTLSSEGHDITVVDNNKVALDRAAETLDIMTISGNGANVETLLTAGADTADMVIAVTASDETNMVVCLAARQLGAKHAVPRIRNPEYNRSLPLLLEKLSLDTAINPESIAAYEISRLLRYPFATSIESFAHGRVEMVEFRVKKGDPIIGVTLSEQRRENPGALYVAAERKGETIIPDGSFAPQEDDRIWVLADLVTLTAYFKKLGRSTERVRSAMLIGGGHISYYLCNIFQGMNMRFKIIEIRHEKCRELDEKLKGVMVVCGDGTDKETLDRENLAGYDAMICLTDRDEENLVVGLYGSKVGVKKVIVKIDRISFLDTLGDLGVDSVVSPKLSSANQILRLVRARSQSGSSTAEKLYRFMDNQVEALEFKALTGAPYCGIPLSSLKLKNGIVVAMIVRGRDIIIPFGGAHIEPGDTVLVTVRSHRITTLDEILRT